MPCTASITMRKSHETISSRAICPPVSNEGSGRIGSKRHNLQSENRCRLFDLAKDKTPSISGEFLVKKKTRWLGSIVPIKKVLTAYFSIKTHVRFSLFESTTSAAWCKRMAMKFQVKCPQWVAKVRWKYERGVHLAIIAGRSERIENRLKFQVRTYVELIYTPVCVPLKRLIVVLHCN